MKYERCTDENVSITTTPLLLVYEIYIVVHNNPSIISIVSLSYYIRHYFKLYYIGL